jgi:hypothetical protein
VLGVSCDGRSGGKDLGGEAGSCTGMFETSGSTIAVVGGTACMGVRVGSGECAGSGAGVVSGSEEEGGENDGREGGS